MSRVEKAKQAQGLRAEGLLLREIAERLGVAVQTAHDLITDPDQSKRRARVDKYRGECIDCKGPTDGSNGFASTPLRCKLCHARSQHEDRYWTPERVIEALRDWAAAIGRTPTAEMATRGAPVCVAIVQREFGTWAEGLRAAGLPPNRLGRPPKVAA